MRVEPRPPWRKDPGSARAWRFGASFLVSVTWALGCTSLLGIDGDYVSGEAGTSLQSSTDGSSAGAAAGGSSGSAAHDDASTNLPSTCVTTSDCAASTKCCGVDCVTPSPAVGCSLEGCSACPEPIENAEAFCDGDRCSARCKTGFKPGNGACVPLDFDGGAGGAGGVGGTGGTGGTGGGIGGTPVCNVSACPRCTTVSGVVPCCEQGATCGCTWFKVGNLGYCI